MFEHKKYSIGCMIHSLKVVGIYPVKTNYPTLNSLQVLWGYFLFTWFVTFIITEFIEMYYIWGNLSDMTTNATVSLIYLMGFSRVYILICMKPKVRKASKFIFEMEDDIMVHKDQDTELYAIFQSYSQRSRDIHFSMSIMTSFTILACFLIPHTEMYLSGPTYVKFENGSFSDVIRKPLVFSSWFPFDSNGEVGYIVAFGLQVISGCIGALFLFTSGLYMGGMMIFAAGQLELVQSKFRNLGNSKNCDVGGLYQDVYSELCNCIKHHVKIIQFVEYLKKWINLVMFLDFLVCSLMLCAIGYQAAKQEFSIRLFFVVEYLGAMLVQLFMFYWYANGVLDQSLKVADSAWESNWYTFDIKARKALCFVIMRSQRPLTFTAGPFNEMSLITFVGILKTAYTYLTLLLQVEGQEN